MAALAARTDDRNYAFEAKVKTHIQETARPESCEGLSWTRPPKDQPYLIIWQFVLSPTKRDRVMAPCPACSPNAPKYFWGAFAWFPLEKLYRCIGRECAGHAIGRAQADAAKREYRQRREHEFDYEFVYENLPLVPAMRRHFDCLEREVARADSYIRGFGRAQVRGIIYNAVKEADSLLVVWDAPAESMLSAASNVSASTRVRFGRLVSGEILNPKLHVLRKVREYVAMLGALDHGEGDEAREWVLERYGRRDDFLLFRKALIGVSEVQQQAQEYLSGVRKFFCAENFDLLARFGSDRRNPHPFFASFRAGMFRIGQTRDSAISVRPTFAAIESMPEWPPLVVSPTKR